MPVSYEYLSAIRSPHKSINNGFPLFQDCPVFAIVLISAANRLIGEVVQSRRRPLLGPSPG